MLAFIPKNNNNFINFINFVNLVNFINYVVCTNKKKNKISRRINKNKFRRKVSPNIILSPMVREKSINILFITKNKNNA